MNDAVTSLTRQAFELIKAYKTSLEPFAVERMLDRMSKETVVAIYKMLLDVAEFIGKYLERNTHSEG